MISVLPSQLGESRRDGAQWIRNVCEEGVAGWNLTFILDLFHALEDAVVAVQALNPGQRRTEGMHELDQGAVGRRPGRLGHHHS